MRKKIFFFALVALSYFSPDAYCAAHGSPGESPFDFDVTYVKPSSSYEHAHSSTLLVTCVDFRLQDEVQKLMELLGLVDKYDEVVLPGASLAIAGADVKAKVGADDIPVVLNWGEASASSMLACKALHSDINRIIIIDHENCGAYKLAYPGDMPAASHSAPPCGLAFHRTSAAGIGEATSYLHYHLLDGAEKAVHIARMTEAVAKIRGYKVVKEDDPTKFWHPFEKIAIYPYIMHIDGLVENWTREVPGAGIPA